MAAEIVYLLCTGTALVCCVLLFRGWRQSRAQLLFWSGLCFASLTLENFFLFLDKIVFLQIDLWWCRASFALLAVFFLLYGLIWKDK
ncbi:MAG TPA: DUF5985 family protein [Verrucomicrobiae bacterium]